MDAPHLAPYGYALQDYYYKNKPANIIIRRNDGLENIIPVRHFFRKQDEFSVIERKAHSQCTEHVLDIGAGVGIHTLYLQAAGNEVTALDICQQVVDIMHDRKIKNFQQENIFAFLDGPFDTLLLLGHGIGMVRDITGLKKFLVHTHGLLHQNGILILDSLDVR